MRRMTDDPLDGPLDAVPPSDADLRRLTDEERAREHAAERSRERWLRQQASESTTLWSLLRVAAEHEAELGLRTASGRAHLGVVRSLGADFCLLVGPHQPGVYVPFTAITAVTLTSRLDIRTVEDEREDPDAVRLMELLAEEVGDRPRVGVASAGDPERVVGDLEVVGRDVLGVRTEGARRSLVYVPITAVTEVAFL
jgi:hypothetical protein